MANTYSEDRPLFAGGPQTPLFKAMSDYAYKPDVQELLQKMTADLFSERPQDPLAWMIQWLSEEKRKREVTGQ